MLKQTFVGVDGDGFKKAIIATEDELNFVNGVTSDIQTQLDDLTAALNVAITNTVPIGGYIPYTGLFADIPANWQIADGTNGTSDMTDVFMYGTTIEADVGEIGGNAASALPEHSHTINHSHSATTNTTGNHSHTWVEGVDDGSDIPRDRGISAPDGFDTSRTSSDLINAAGNHSHSVTVVAANLSSGNTGVADISIANLPPYIKFAYIVRMS